MFRAVFLPIIRSVISRATALVQFYCTKAIVPLIKIGNLQCICWFHSYGDIQIRADFWLENLEEKYRLEVPVVDGRTILKWTLRNLIGGYGLD